MKQATALAPACRVDESSGVVSDILYISGTGRTGTTVLEILLSNNPGVVGVGEMKHIIQHGFLENRACACGSPTQGCSFWSPVMMTTGWDDVDSRRLAKIMSAVDSHKQFPFLYAGLTGRGRLEAYREANAALFNAVAASSRARLIVDSSKYPGRAWILGRLFAPRVKVLHITRSPDELIAAFKKKNVDEQRPKSLLAVAAYYLYVLLCMTAVRMRLKDKCLSIRYEDLRRDPEAVLARIEAWSGHSFANARQKLIDGDRFAVGHIVTGNRLRKHGSISFDRARAEPAPTRGAERAVAQALGVYRRVLGF